jgi:hypothetical protein
MSRAEPYALYALSLPEGPARRVDAFARQSMNKTWSYNLVTNNCVTFVKDTLRYAGLEPPLWAVTGASLAAWARLIGAAEV